MQFVVTAQEMQEYDNNTITHIGIPGLVLMERAALKLKEAIDAKIARPRTMLIVTGTGNNGGDGLALARLYAQQDCFVTVCCLGVFEKRSEAFRVQRNIIEHYPVRLLEGERVAETLLEFKDSKAGFDVIVDAIFGVGLKRTVGGIYAEALDAMNALIGYKVAVDIPSGICADNGKVLGCAFKADTTVTFGFAKRGLYLYPGADYTGQLIVADIGIDSGAFMGCPPKVFTYKDYPFEYLPAREKAGNKGTFGKVLLIAGFEKMAGAAILSAKAALQSGAGMVKVIMPEENRFILQNALPEVMCASAEDLEKSLIWADVVAIGPGLGKSADVVCIMKQVLENCDLPLIVDADALNLISENEGIKRAFLNYAGHKIMTPHMGEWARLEGISVKELKEDVFTSAIESAKRFSAVLVCKDARTLVVHPDGRIYLNTTGNNGMATAGSGDVLTGLVSGMIAQGDDVFAMTTLSVYLHGLAGDRARDIYTEYGVTAGRIVDNIKWSDA